MFCCSATPPAPWRAVCLLGGGGAEGGGWTDLATHALELDGGLFVGRFEALQFALQFALAHQQVDVRGGVGQVVVVVVVVVGLRRTAGLRGTVAAFGGRGRGHTGGHTIERLGGRPALEGRGRGQGSF